MQNDTLMTELWEEVENKNTQLAKKMYNWLNHDNLGGIFTDNTNYWTEKTYSGADFPNYAWDYIGRFMAKRGYEHIYKGII